MGVTPAGVDDVRDAERLRLDIWHPDCWTLQVTEAVDAGLVAHGVYEVDDAVKARVIAHGNDSDAIDGLVAEARASPLTDTVREVAHEFGSTPALTPGNATRSLIVTYRSTDSIYDALVSRGMLPDEPIRISDGRERWTVIDEGSGDPEQRLEEVRREMDAEIAVTGTGSTVGTHASVDDHLTERQREVFETARRNGYYRWPREVSAGELADQLGVSKATLLEHLRKAEAKLLDPPGATRSED